MARPKKRSNEQAKTSSLLNAIRFVSLATKDVGQLNERHLYLGGHWAAASNGVITIASKVEEDIFACPQANLMNEALVKCGNEFEIKKLETKLSLKTAKFKAIVPCIDPTLLSIPSPDEPIAEINDNLRIALEAVSVLVNENAQTIVGASILLNGTSVITTDRSIIIEYWHGIDLPKGLSIPKTVIQPLSKSGKKLTRLGFSSSSITFYFEDESWIKTQLFVEKWPDIDGILNRPSNQLQLPKDFWEGFDAVSPFSEDGAVYFDAGVLRSHPTNGVGAAFDVPGLPKGPSFAARSLALLKGLAPDTVDFFCPGPFEGSTMLSFQGKNVRGALAVRSS